MRFSPQWGQLLSYEISSHFGTSTAISGKYTARTSSCPGARTGRGHDPHLQVRRGQGDAVAQRLSRVQRLRHLGRGRAVIAFGGKASPAGHLLHGRLGVAAWRLDAARGTALPPVNPRPMVRTSVLELLA